jgi:uncharacterized protein
MNHTNESHVLEPVSQAERYSALDALRGLALLGVLLVNLHSDFRISLSERLQGFHKDPSWMDRLTDIAIAGIFEFKAFTLFSILFGVGLAVFAERAIDRGAKSNRLLFRRLIVLLILGLVHLFLIWNGDILTLYAICGFLLLPLLQLPTGFLAIVGMIAIALPYFVPWGFTFPDSDTLLGLVAEASQVYRDGSFWDVWMFHIRETKLLIMPLLIYSLPKTWGLMAIGVVLWRIGIFKDPTRYSPWFLIAAVIGIGVGGIATILSVYTESTGLPTGVPFVLLQVCSYIPLAFGYGAILLLLWRFPFFEKITKPFAAVGQMALTNYLTQSIILSLVFYGYGLGLYGRTGSTIAIGVGLILYVIQMIGSQAWLHRYRFGPVEWLWRSLTYGRWQPMRLHRDKD